MEKASKLKALTEKWLEKHDPVKKYKKSPKYKISQKQKLARIKAHKQEYSNYE